MLKNKLVKGMLVSSTMVSLFAVAPIHAAEPTASGETTATYVAGYTGPTDPVKPGQEDTDPNNWVVSYPKSIVLTDNNLIDKTKYALEKDKGVKLKFKVTQKISSAGNQNKDVTLENVGNGIKVTVNAKDTQKWVDEGITMDATQGSGTATMGIGNADALQKHDGSVDFITLGTGMEAENTDVRAVLLDTSAAKDGAIYETQLIFTFTRTPKP